MKIEYDKFTYDGAWYAKDNIEFDGRDCNVDIQIYGYDEEIIPESSKNVFDCDIEIYDEEWVKDFENDDSWLEDLMGPGISSYSDMKPFARDGTGALWVVINDEMIGYIGTEGECGIVAKSIDDFMNIIAFDFNDCCRVKILQSEEAFLKNACNSVGGEHAEVFGKFIEEHGFTKEWSELYRMIIDGLTVRPFLEIKATDEDYCDSYSLLGSDDGQESLLQLIELLKL